MKLNKNTMLMYVVTDRTWLGNNSLAEQVEEAIKAGATFVQLREKDATHDEFLQLAKEIKKITDKYNVPFVINDNIDIAVEVDADGVHIGQNDEELLSARKRLGENKIIGVSTQTVEQAKLAEKNGADYIGVGAAFSTSTKNDADTLPHQQFVDVCSSVSIPVVAIGGIDKDNIMKLKETHVDGVAVISAIFAKKDIYKATSELLDLSKQMVND
ncbi:thiamine phosphate synthase [Sedimentibacter sp. zth1]|uniref:thiamine phosphate synthase n=1 Tax=Sedimentibacter sp. zth1 TaxID=2816908 RepID=UPI001A912E77|nr:thiamine phosphate synthase [Sedimentibacter sp. zth1]QSX06313.1 thiamine phosphate synthase [Sedimentibacter sp. zth1]